MTKLHFILDCDDVLLDWCDGFRKWLAIEKDAHPCPMGPESWSLGKWLDVDDDTACEWIAEFNATAWFGWLRSMGDAQYGVGSLLKAGHQITVLTSCSRDSITVERRRNNLAHCFGDRFEDIVCLDLGESKENHLRSMRKGIWVEDNYKNALGGMQAGHKTFMMRRRHNRADEATSHPDIVWVDNFLPIVSLFN